MKLSNEEKRILELIILQYMARKEEAKVIPEDIRSKFTPEMIQFTLSELQAKGLVEYLGGSYTLTKKAQEIFKKVKVVKEEIIAWGHPDISSVNKTRITITREDKPKDDSIIGVKANKACNDLRHELKERLKMSEVVNITLNVDGIEEKITAFGSPALELSNKKEIVIRKDDMTDDKTLAILADKAACELKEELRKKIKNKKNKIKILIEA